MIYDPNAVWTSKAIIIGILIYLINPFDLVPDAIPFAGLLDDASVIASAVAALGYVLEKYLIEN